MMDDSGRTVAKRRGGQPGNVNGCKNRPLRALLLELVNEHDRRKLEAGLRKVLDMAANGDLAAMSFIFDRIDGKPKQAVDVSAEALAPVVVVQRPQITRDEWLRIHSVPAPVPAIEAPRNDGDK